MSFGRLLSPRSAFCGLRDSLAAAVRRPWLLAILDARELSEFRPSNLIDWMEIECEITLDGHNQQSNLQRTGQLEGFPRAPVIDL